MPEIKCAECGRERTESDQNYTPMQVMFGQPIGWYSGDDCGKKFVVVIGSQYNEPYTAWRALTDRTRGGFDR